MTSQFAAFCNPVPVLTGYSVNTIYAYRSKVRGKSRLDKEAFDGAVMGILSTTTGPASK